MCPPTFFSRFISLLQNGWSFHILLGVKDIEKLISETLFPEPYILFALLFGSRAKGKVHPLSDYDIAVFLDVKKVPQSPYGIKSRITSLFSGRLKTQRVQIIILNEASPLLAFEAVNKGRLVFAKDAHIHHEFVFQTYQRYFDLKKLYQLQEDRLLERIKDGTYGG